MQASTMKIIACLLRHKRSTWVPPLIITHSNSTQKRRHHPHHQGKADAALGIQGGLRANQQADTKRNNNGRGADDWMVCCIFRIIYLYLDFAACAVVRSSWEKGAFHTARRFTFDWSEFSDSGLDEKILSVSLYAWNLVALILFLVELSEVT